MDRFCRGCLVRFDEPTDLLQYTEKNRRLFVYSTGIQVKRTDTFTFQICKDCYLHMKAACNFKKQCRNSDKRYKSYQGLKENGDDLDFTTYLKNSDDSWTFRFTGNSTPAYQKVKDDDNESTTTSIRNFMMDMMPDDDLPDTEARIIKEVIDEEADILDDSMDSHWLQDDASIDTDFRLDFSFSPFSTPRPVNNDRYTPNKSLKKSIEKTKGPKQIDAVTKKVLNNLDMPLIDDESNHSFVPLPLTVRVDDSNQTIKAEYDEQLNCALSPIKVEIDPLSNQPLVSVKVERNFDETMDSLDVVNEFLNYESENGNRMDVVSPSLSTIDKHLKEAFEDIDEEVQAATQRIIDRNLEEVLEIKEEEESAAPCTIDKNLEKALEDTENKEFSLDELLVSPKVIPSIQSPPTPLINNILFGEKLDMDENSNSSQNYKAGRCIETFENVTGDVEMSEEFSTQIDVKIELDIEEIKTEIIDEIERDANQDNESNFCCNICQKKFEDAERLERHSRRHIVLDELQTEIVDEIGVEETVQQDFDVTNFYCNMCQKQFKNIIMLKRHAKRHQTKSKPPKKWICDYCAREVTDRTNFLRHVKTHMRERKIYKCEECNLEFTLENAYNQHRRTHRGEKPTLLPTKKQRFVCTDCGWGTEKGSNFQIHLNRHQKNFTHTCPECSKGFFRQCDLTIHMRFHTGEKPFKCPHCPMSFTRKDSFGKHIKRHLDLKPFQCKFCKSRFITIQSMNYHLKNSKRCIKDREKISRDQKEEDDNTTTQTFVTEELLVNGNKLRCIKDKESIEQEESDDNASQTNTEGLEVG